jgi:hypothetical protein
MTVLDPTGQIKIDRPPVGDHVFVELPLAVRSETWIHEFKPLARTKDFWADVRDLPEGTFLTVLVPAAASREETAELLDQALRLIDEAQALANARRSALAPTEPQVEDCRPVERPPVALTDQFLERGIVAYRIEVGVPGGE